MKSNSCLFERLFEIKKSGVFLFGISFFLFETEIMMFFFIVQLRKGGLQHTCTK